MVMMMSDGLNLRELLESTHNYRGLSSDQLSSHLDQVSKHNFVASTVAMQLEGSVSGSELQESTAAFLKFSDENFEGDPKAALEFLEEKVSNNPQIGEMGFSQFVKSEETTSTTAEMAALVSLEPYMPTPPAQDDAGAPDIAPPLDTKETSLGYEWQEAARSSRMEEPTAVMETAKNDTGHLNWEEVIHIDRDPYHFKNTSPEEAEHNTQRLENFLDYVENTEQGQEMLKSIQSKQCLEEADYNGTNKLTIALGDNRASSSDTSGRVFLNINDPQNTAFIDKETGEVTPLSFERMTFHELVHATDPKLAIGMTYDKFLPEEYATQKTDEFARNYMPELGQRGVYPNFAGQSPTDGNGNVRIDGKELLESRNDVRETISKMLEYDLQVGANRQYEEKGTLEELMTKMGFPDQQGPQIRGPGMGT